MIEQKRHGDPIIYRAYGTVRGIYSPSSDNPDTGILTTDDGVKFPVTISYEIAALLEHEANRLQSIALWKCYFRTRPTTLHLKKVQTENVDKNRQHSFKVNKFQVDGKILKIGKETVSVQIKSNESNEKPFTVTLKGTIEGDLSHAFWRLKLKREGKSFEIENAYPIGLPKTSTQSAFLTETQPKLQTKTQPTTRKPRVFNLVEKGLKT